MPLALGVLGLSETVWAFPLPPPCKGQKNIFYGLLPSLSLGTANIVKGFETPKHFITFPPLFITFSPFSAKSAKVGAVEEWAVNGRCRCFCFVRTLHHSGAVISVRLFSVFLGCGCVGGFNLNRQPFARLQHSPVVALSPLWRCGCSSARCRLSVVALWRFPCRSSLFARCSADKKPTKGAKFHSAPLFRPRWAVAPPRSLPCRVGSLSASLRVCSLSGCSGVIPPAVGVVGGVHLE